MARIWLQPFRIVDHSQPAAEDHKPKSNDNQGDDAPYAGTIHRDSMAGAFRFSSETILYLPEIDTGLLLKFDPAVLFMLAEDFLQPGEKTFRSGILVGRNVG